MDVGEDTTLSDGNILEQHVELLIVADGKLDVAGVDPRPLVVTRGVASQLEDLGSEVLEDSSQVHGGTRPDPVSVPAFLQEPVERNVSYESCKTTHINNNTTKHDHTHNNTIKTYLHGRPFLCLLCQPYFFDWK